VNTDDNQPPLIWKINITGVVLFLAGMIMCIVPTQQHHWFQMAQWAAIGIGGWFLITIRIPFKYPERLFSFDWYTLLQPMIYTILLIGVAPSMGIHDIPTAIPWIGGLWSIFLTAEVAMRLGGRIGLRLTRKKTTK
jgi:hypothetical protein